MNKLTKKFVTAIAAGAVLANALTPMAFANTEITVSGNGAYSANEANVAQTNTTAVVQNNTSVVTNTVTSNANTGNNDASFNTGGDVAIKTGNAITDVKIDNKLNENVADVDVCDCDGDLKVNISGNGAGSDNDANVAKTNATSLFQTNMATVTNAVSANADSGNNSAGFNTNGDVTILTGNAGSIVDLSTEANKNWAQVGGSNGNGGSVEAIISGNGAYSVNDLNLGLTNSVALVQDNTALVTNAVAANANSGHNDAGFNTGGDVAIKTGFAKTWVEVDNMLNFNAADVDCGCFESIKASVSGNGAYADSDINAAFVNALTAFQDNIDVTTNALNSNADSGWNGVSFNTGEAEGDPFVWTGDATTHESVSNSGNSNIFGSLPDVALPENVHFDFDWSEIFWFLHIA